MRRVSTILTDYQPGEGAAVVNAAAAAPKKEDGMLWTICVILIVLWLLGMVTSYTMGGLIHVLLVIAIIMVLVNVISGRR
jgi:predicted lipid-binding transport protein (Tim44 family)